MTTTLDPRVRYPALHNPNWLRRLYVDEGIPQGGIAKLAGGCSDVTVSHALKRHGIRRPPGWKPPPVELPSRAFDPEREFEGLEQRLGPLADLDVEVPPAELERRLSEGLTDLAELVRLAGELPREQLWGLVVDQVDAPTARSVVFAAAGPSDARRCAASG